MISDELRDTLFFATGDSPTRTRHTSHWSLNVPGVEVKIVHNKLISVNGDKCRSPREAKYVICQACGFID